MRNAHSPQSVIPPRTHRCVRHVLQQLMLLMLILLHLHSHNKHYYCFCANNNTLLYCAMVHCRLWCSTEAARQASTDGHECAGSSVVQLLVQERCPGCCSSCKGLQPARCCSASQGEQCTAVYRSVLYLCCSAHSRAQAQLVAQSCVVVSRCDARIFAMCTMLHM
jgi:hypothetical protein